MIATNRIYTDSGTGEKFRLHRNETNHDFSLISDGSEKLAKGTEVKGFYLCAFDAVSIKINNSKIVNLGMGEFYNLQEGEKVTHKKFTLFKKFRKV